jgi:hypothetical protein
MKNNPGFWRMIATCAGFLLTAACDEAGAPAPATAKNGSEEDSSGETAMTKSRDTPATPDWAKWTCDATGRIDLLDGKTIEELQIEFGPASIAAEFPLSERQDEFHISLQNKYPLSKSGNEKTLVKEMTWTGPACKITVWLDQQDGKWRTFDSLIYSVNSEF